MKNSELTSYSVAKAFSLSSGNKTRIPAATHIELELLARATRQEKINVNASKLQGEKKQSTGSMQSLLKFQWPFFEEVEKLTLRSIYYRIAKGA